MSRYARRVDTSHRDIVLALRAAGATVIVHQPTEPGEPDLFVGYRRRTIPMEVKTPGHRKTGSAAVHLAQQAEWRSRWRGSPCVVVETPEEALHAIGAT